MRLFRHVLTAFLFSSVLFPFIGAGQSLTHDFDVKHYDESLTFNLANRSISGITTISAAALSDTLDTMFVYFGGDSMHIDSIDDMGKSLPFFRLGDSTIIILKKPVIKNDTFRITIWYGGAPTNEAGNTGFGGVYFDTNEAYTMDVGMTLSSVSATRLWMPCYDLPDDKATITLKITVPSQYTAVSVGALTQTQNSGGTTTYTWNEMHNVALSNVGFVVAPFIRTQLDPSLNVDLYSIGADSAMTAILKAETESSLPFFDSLYSPFPFDKLSFAQISARALSQQSLIECDTTVASVIFDKTRVADWIANEWWGSLVTPQNTGEYWLQEAMAAYSQALYIQHTQGNSAYERFLDSVHRSYYHDAQFEQALTLEGYNRLFPSSNFPATLSEKGAAVIAMLRRFVGDSVFFGTLHNYITANAFGWMTTQTFENAFARQSPAPVQNFFSQWVQDSGWAQMNVAWNRGMQDDSDDIISLHVSQTQQSRNWPLFSMPITLRFYSTLNSGERDTTERMFYLQATASQDTAFIIHGHGTFMVFNSDNVALAEVQTLTDVRDPAFIVRLPSMNIFPDPVSQNATVAIGSLPTGGRGTIEIVNANGIVCEKTEITAQADATQTTRIPVATLPDGIYFLRYSDNNFVATQKFTVVH